MSALPRRPELQLRPWRFYVQIGGAEPFEMVVTATSCNAAERQIVADVLRRPEWVRGFGLWLHPEHQTPRNS